MPKTKRTLKSNNPRLDVNLKEVFGKRLPESPALKTAIGQAMLDKILERTEGGRSFTGSKFPKYSEQYIKSNEFEAFGKTPGEINMSLRGDMMGQLDFELKSKNVLQFKWEDPTQAAKAHGHITGNVGKKRDFLGLSDKELNQIKNEFKDAVEEEPRATEVSFNDLILGFIDRVLDGSEG